MNSTSILDTSIGDDCVLTRVASAYAGSPGIPYQQGHDNIQLIDCTSDHDGYVDPSFDRGSGVNDVGGGIKIVCDRTSNAHGQLHRSTAALQLIAGYRQDGIEASATDKGYGIWIDSVVCTDGNQNIVRNCTAANSRQAGFFCEKSDYQLWHHHYSLRQRSGRARMVGSNLRHRGLTQHNEFYHITLYGNVQESVGYDDRQLACVRRL